MKQFFTLPDKATIFVLLQRTEQIKFRDSLLYRAIKQYTPSVYRVLLATEARIRSPRIKSDYLHDMYDEYLSIKPFLPATCTTVLDIGCGIAGIDLYLQKHYENRSVDFFLLDKTKISRDVYYGFKDKGAFYNSLEIARQVLVENGVNELRVNPIVATDDNQINITRKIDLIISLISWGFHYPIETYLDQAYDILNDNGVLILDIRRSDSGYEKLAAKFRKCMTITNRGKFTRVCALK